MKGIAAWIRMIQKLKYDVQAFIGADFSNAAKDFSFLVFGCDNAHHGARG